MTLICQFDIDYHNLILRSRVRAICRARSFRHNCARRTKTARRGVLAVRTGSDTPKPCGAFLCALWRVPCDSAADGHARAPFAVAVFFGGYIAKELSTIFLHFARYAAACVLSFAATWQHTRIIGGNMRKPSYCKIPLHFARYAAACL